MGDGIGLTEEDQGRIEEYLEKYPYERQPDDLLPSAGDDAVDE